MELIADVMLVAGALGAAVYCLVLSRRLRRFNDLENGMGGAIAVLSAQVDDMTQALKGARVTAQSSSSALVGLTDRAEGVAQRLELLVASLHDLPLGAGPDAPLAQENVPEPQRSGEEAGTKKDTDPAEAVQESALSTAIPQGVRAVSTAPPQPPQTPETPVNTPLFIKRASVGPKPPAAMDNGAPPVLAESMPAPAVTPAPSGEQLSFVRSRPGAHLTQPRRPLVLKQRAEAPQ